MLNKPASCNGCVLANNNGGFSITEGSGKNGVMIVGEALGDREKFDGLPFRPHAEAGSSLQTAFRLLGVDRDNFVLSNIVHCQPPYNKLEGTDYEYPAVEHCKIYLDSEIKKFKPKVILALGNVPLKHLHLLTPEVKSYIEDLQSTDNKKAKAYLKKFKISSLRGYILPTIYNIPMIPSLHPSFITREGRIYIGVLMRDIKTAIQLANGEIPKFSVKYNEKATIKEAEAFYQLCKTNSDLLLSHDIETPDTTIQTDESEIEYENIEVRNIDSIQFSIKEKTGIFFPWYGEYIPIIKKILELPNPKIGHNSWAFDKTNIEYHLGKGIIKGLNIDTMWCLHGATKIPLYKKGYAKVKSIKEIVDNKLSTIICGYDETGKQIPVKVIGWHKNKVNSQTWIRVNHSLNNRPIYVTPEHKVFADGEMIEARDLQLGMQLVMPNLGADDFIHGSLLGDGWFNPKNNTLNISHGECQETYAELKAAYLGTNLTYFDFDSNGYQGNKLVHRFDKKWRDIFYTKQGKKFVPPPTNRALAIWYMDDGNLSNILSKDGFDNGNYIVRIPLQGFINWEEAFTWLKSEFCYDSNKGLSKYKQKNGWMACLTSNALQRFLKRIYEYIPECMQYKLPFNYKNKYNNWFNLREPQTAKITKLTVGTKVVPSIDRNIRYCITVDHPTHRFFTLGGLVSNCWKWLNQDFVTMGRSLQFATNFYAPEFPAWKHLAQLEAEHYGVLDVDATLRLFNGLKRDLSNKRLSPETKSLYEGFIDDVVKLKPILDWTSENGFPIDPVERLKFKAQIEEERTKTLNELQDLYPTELRKVTPSEGYKFVPKEVLEVEELFKKASNVINDGLFYVVESDKLYNKRLAQYLEEHTRHDGTTGLVLKEFIIDGGKELRWCRMEEFKPSSSKQVLDYIKLKKYKVPKKKEHGAEDKETTGKDEIYHLWEETNDLLFEKVIYYRELDKMLKTYVGTGKTGWRTGHDGRIHTTFTFLPATGQLSSRNPNIQNAPARGTKFSSRGYRELATQFRKTIAASTGKVLLSADWSAFHALTLAFEAEDADYMRVVRLDPHSFVTAHILSGDLPLKIYKLQKTKPANLDNEEWKRQIVIGEETLERFKTLSTWLSLSDDKLREHLQFIKKNYKFVRDSQAKPAILGMGFGMGVKKFYKVNRHTFKNEAEPKRILGLIQKLFPKTFIDYHEKIKALADRQTYLISRYGYIRRFYDVYDWRLMPSYRQPTPKFGEKLIRNAKGQWWLRKDGQDANNAIAYLPSNDAFGFKKEAMRNFWEHPNGNLIKKYGLINEIHDDLFWEIDKGLINEGAPIIKQIMQSPAQYLKNSTAPNGLVCAVEIKIGPNWADMEELKI